MPEFSTLEDQIIKELKNYNDEDMFKIYNVILNTISNNKKRVQQSNIENLENFNQLKEIIKKTLLKESENEVKYCFQAIKNSQKIFIKKEILDNFKKDLALCLFTLSNLSINFLRKKEYPYNLNDLVITNNTSNKITTIPCLQKNSFTFISKNYIYINFIFNIFYYNVTESDLIKIKAKYEDENKIKQNRTSKFNEKKFIDWCYDYLLSKNQDFEEQSKFILNDADKKILIISYLDFLYLSDHQEHEILTMRMSKAWSQKKFRDADKVKKNYHIPLTLKAKEELSELSIFKNTSEAKILEDLIHQMFLDQMCDENGKSKY